MTYTPPPQPNEPIPTAVPYYSPGAMPPSANLGRPTSITTIGVIGIVVAIITLLNQLGGLLLFSRQFASMPDGTYIRIVALVSSALAILLLVASIGTLRTLPWARGAMLLWAGIFIPYNIVSGIVAMTYIPQKLAALPSGTDVNTATIAAYTVATIVLAIFLIYPIFVIVVMRSPRVVSAFAAYNPNVYR